MADEKERHSKVYNHAEKRGKDKRPAKKEPEHQEPDGDEGGDESLATGAADEMGARHQQEAADLDKGHAAEMKEHAAGQARMVNRHVSQRKSMMARHAAEMGGQAVAAGPPDEGGEGAPPAEPPAPAV